MTEATTIGHFFVLVVLLTLYTHFSAFAFLQLQFFFTLHRNTWLWVKIETNWTCCHGNSCVQSPFSFFFFYSWNVSVTLFWEKLLVHWDSLVSVHSSSLSVWWLNGWVGLCLWCGVDLTAQRSVLGDGHKAALDAHLQANCCATLSQEEASCCTELTNLPGLSASCALLDLWSTLKSTRKGWWCVRCSLLYYTITLIDAKFIILSIINEAFTVLFVQPNKLN